MTSHRAMTLIGTISAAVVPFQFADRMGFIMVTKSNSNSTSNADPFAGIAATALAKLDKAATVYLSKAATFGRKQREGILAMGKAAVVFSKAIPKGVSDRQATERAGINRSTYARYLAIGRKAANETPPVEATTEDMLYRWSQGKALDAPKKKSGTSGKATGKGETPPKGRNAIEDAKQVTANGLVDALEHRLSRTGKGADAERKNANMGKLFAESARDVATVRIVETLTARLNAEKGGNKGAEIIRSLETLRDAIADYLSAAIAESTKARKAS